MFQEQELTGKVSLSDDNVHLSNMMILYNNMLQSLFDSQIRTLGIVVMVLSLMFLILFRSLKIAVIAMIANIIPVSVIFGFMGWTDIALVMDDTIHYIHRYGLEFSRDKNYIAAMHRSHNSIGYAMYYTSVIIMIGF